MFHYYHLETIFPPSHLSFRHTLSYQGLILHMSEFVLSGEMAAFEIINKVCKRKSRSLPSFLSLLSLYTHEFMTTNIPPRSLKYFRSSNDDSSEAKRWLIIGAHQAGASEKRVARISGLSKTAVRHIILNYQRTGNPCLPKREPKKGTVELELEFA